MLSVLICSTADLSRQLANTLIGRVGIDRFRAMRLEEARLLASTVCPRVILVDRDLPKAAEFVQALREEAPTRRRSLAVLAWGDFEPFELELLQLGANAILRLPPDPGWDDRMARLLSVPARQEARLPVQLAVESAECAGLGAEALNLSVGGMLLDSRAPLRLFQEISFRCKLPDGRIVAGRGRVMRQASQTLYGLEFTGLDDDAKEAVRQFVRSSSVGAFAQ